MSNEDVSNEMQQNTTGTELSPKQHQAIELLLQGRSITDVSKVMKVDRTTIYRWQGDVYFEAERNKKARELRDASKARLTQLAEKSLAVIDDALDAGDAKTALAVLKGIGYLPGAIAPIGSTDAEQLETEREVERKRKDHEATMALWEFSL